MNKSQRHELQSILDAAASRPRPACDYTAMSTEQFVFLWSYLRCVEVFSALIVVAGACRNRGSRIRDEELTEIMNTVEPHLTQPGILKLAEWYYEPGLFLILAECMGEDPYVTKEIENRVADRQIGKYLAIAPATIGTDADASLMGKLLKLEKITSYRKREYGADDLKQMGFLKAWETIETESKVNSVSLPSYPLSLRPDVQGLWETCIAEVWKWDIENNWGRIKAGLSLTDEFIREKVRDNSRNLFDTVRRRLKERIKSARDIGDTVHGQIHNPEEYSLRNESENEEIRMAALAYEYVESRWKTQGRAFADELARDEGSVTSASDAAGKSRTAGHTLLKELRNHLSKK